MSDPRRAKAYGRTAIGGSSDSQCSTTTRFVDVVFAGFTGVSGSFDIELEAAEIKAAPDYKPGPSDFALPPAAGPTIFVALQQPLGLKLEPVVGALAVIVIDQADRP